MLRKLILLAAACLAAAPFGLAQAATRSILYVANSQGDDITVIDLATQKVLTTLKVGPIVHGVCAQGDGRRAFATIESEHSLKVIDTRTNTVTDTIALGGQPNECAATTDGHYVVVPLLAPANSAAIVDMTQKKIVKTLPLRHPHNCFTPEGGSNTVVYCEERDAYRINRIDLTKMEYTDYVKVAGDPRPFIVSADEKTLVFSALFHAGEAFAPGRPYPRGDLYISGWDGATQFKLENGQVWRQTEPGVYYVKPVDSPAVLIEKVFGSWRLYDQNGGWVKVVRIK